MPQTAADLEMRVVLIKQLAAKHPKVAWTLCMTRRTNGSARQCEPMPPKLKTAPAGAATAQAIETEASPTKTRRPYKRRPVVMYPEPVWTEWEDPDDFAEAFQLHVERHGENVYRLHKAITAQGFKIDPQTLYKWKRGDKEPRSATGLRVLKAIERRYRLPDGYFSSKLAHPGRMITGGGLEKLSMVERRRLAWHLPDDFDLLPRAKRAEILAWVRTVIISGATDYRRYPPGVSRQIKQEHQRT